MYRGYRVEGFFYTAFSIWMIPENFCPLRVQFSFTAALLAAGIPPPSKPSAIHARGGRGLRASFPRDSIPPSRHPPALPFAGKNGRKRKKRKRLTAQEEAPIRHRTGQPRRPTASQHGKRPRTADQRRRPPARLVGPAAASATADSQHRTGQPPARQRTAHRRASRKKPTTYAHEKRTASKVCLSTTDSQPAAIFHQRS